LLAASLALLQACGGGSGSGSTSSSFRLLQFLEDGQNQISRNHSVTFLFSEEVAPNQDFPQRLEIQNVQGSPNSNFSLALGSYVINGDQVTFAPRLPNLPDRSDAGFRAFGDYIVFLKAGPDALVSMGSDTIAKPQEFSFSTNDVFDDVVPTQPPRGLGFLARDRTNNLTFALPRLDPRPTDQALLDNAEVIAAGNVIEPGAGSDYLTPWQFELVISEPVDPKTVTTNTVEMFELFSNATTSGDMAPPAAPPGYFGDTVFYKVPVQVRTMQGLDSDGNLDIRITVTPLFTLVDNTRYQIRFSGNILGLDFRKAFIGENGLTGDGETVVTGGSLPYEEPGGLGYVVEFIARDRPGISASRTLTYDPLEDGINPEKGQTTVNPADPPKDKLNNTLYNPPQDPGMAVGYLAAFGNGNDGPMSVPAGQLVTIDTGDTPNGPVGNPFTVWDLNPAENYLDNTLPGAAVEWDSREAYELNLESLVVSTSGTLRVIGVNPIIFRVQGIAQVNGVLDLAGGDGHNSSTSDATGGSPGAGGGRGGDSVRGNQCSDTAYFYPSTNTTCGTVMPYSAHLSMCGASKWPFATNGEGPGHGNAGGNAAGYSYYSPSSYMPMTGTGGGGGSHATSGTAGSDIISKDAPKGGFGYCAGTYYGRSNSGVVGVRGQPGDIYGDAAVENVTWGGSGGGAGGNVMGYYSSTYNPPLSGGAGGAGGGSVSIFAAGAIIVSGGTVDASGGDGGDGLYAPSTSYSYYHSLSGGGGGGSGGAIVLISGESVSVVGGLLNARGGDGGAAPTFSNCYACNAGGAGGNGFIFLADPDGTIDGLSPGTKGSYPAYGNGYLTVADLGAAGERFGEIHAITELFNVLAADPTYVNLVPGDIVGNVSPNQSIKIYASSAQGDPDNPLKPDPTTEGNRVMIAEVRYQAGSTTVDVFDNMDQLNGAPRDAFVRIDAFFDYTFVVDAALGPFASMDRVTLSYMFND